MKRFFKLLIILVLRRDLRIAGHTVGKHYQRIVGGGIAVHGDHVECINYIFAQCFLKKLFRDRDIRSHESEHGAHIRMNHAGTLAHAADGHCFAVQFDLNRHLFGYSVRSHDRLCCHGARFLCIRLALRQLLHTGKQPVYGNLIADHTGGSHQHRIRRYPEKLCRLVRGLSATVISLSAGGGVGYARINDYCLNVGGMGYHFLIPSDRRSFHHVACKHACRLTWCPAVHHRHVFSVLILNRRLDTCRFKALCCSDTAFYDIHTFITMPFCGYVSSARIQCIIQKF